MGRRLLLERNPIPKECVRAKSILSTVYQNACRNAVRKADDAWSIARDELLDFYVHACVPSRSNSNRSIPLALPHAFIWN